MIEMPGATHISKSISGFDPRSVADCIVWLDAADISTLTLSGTNVTGWRDKSIYANNVNSISTTPPTYSSADSSINFVANSSTFLRGTLSATYSNATVFMIVSIATNPAPAFPRLSILSNSATANSQVIGQLFAVNANNPGVIVYLSTGTNPTGQGINIITFVNNVTFNTKQLISNSSTYVGTAYTVSTLLNGNTQSTSSTSGTFTANVAYTANYNTYTLGNYGGPATAAPGDAFQGKLFEYIVFSRELTTTERQAVEGYLAYKWGLQNSQVLPGTIPGLAMWLDGADSATLFTDTAATTAVTADGNSIASWRDKSTNAYLFTQATLGSRPIYKTSILNGRSITRWNGTSTALQSSITLPFYTSSTSGGSFFVVFMATTVASQRFLMTYQNEVSGVYSGTVSELGYTTGQNGAGNYGLHQGNSSATVAADGTIVINSYVLMSYILATTGTTPANSTIFKNGTSLTATNNLSGFYSAGSYPSANNARFLNIGARVFFGAQATDCWHSGDIAELIWYRTPLSASETRGIETYLARKWSISVPTQVLPTTHSFYSTPPFSRRFQPIDISIPEYWFDAADSDTISVSGSFLTTWLNKGSFTGSNVTPTTANTATSGTTRVNGNNLINIPITQRLQFTSTFPNAGRARFIVTRQTSAGNVQYLFQGGAAVNGNDFLGIETNTLIEVAQGAIVTLQTAAISAQTNLMALLTFFNSSVAAGSNRVALNGSNVTLTTSGLASSYFAGSITTFINGTTGSGQDLGEFISFNQNLTLEEIFKIEGYLAWKWGLQSSLPNTHAFKTFPPSIALPFLPTNIQGCALWLDGNDLSTLTLSGTNIIQWNDKSGNNRNATQLTAANRPVYSFTDKSADTTTNPQFFNMTSMPSAPYDIFVVGTPIASTTAVRTLFRTNTADPGMNPICLEGGATRVGYFTSTAFAPFGSYTWTGSTRNLLFARMNVSKTMSASLNGVIALTADTVAGTASDVILYMGALVVSGSVSQQWGNINEVIFYTTPLSTAQRQYVEGYLASKWNLTRFLPTIHPYYDFSPSQKSIVIIIPGTIATVTLSGLSASGGTITWTTSTNAVNYKWFVGTTFPTALTSGTVGAVLTTAVSFAFVASTNYFAWVIPVSSSGTNGATTQSAAASYSTATAVLITTTGAGSVSLGAGTQILIECWGAGGGSMGQDNSLGAGAGGAFARTTISQTAAFTLFYNIGVGGIGSSTSGGAGGQTWANIAANSVPTASTQGARAAGGNGSGVGSPNNSTQAANSVGQTIFIGGAGGSGSPENGGGGAATPNGNGNNGLAGSGTAGGAAGTGGGAGGTAGASANSGGDGISNVLGGGGGGGSFNNAGGMGGLPGGAGGMGWSTGGTPPTGATNTNPHGFGGDGGRGQIRYTRS